MGQNEFAGYTAHWIDDKWIIRRATLDLDYCPEAHTGENIKDRLRVLSEKTGSAPFQIVADSGANVQLGSRLYLNKPGTNERFCYW